MELCSPREPIATQLVQELWNALDVIYAEPCGISGPCTWTVEPFEQPGSGFMIAWIGDEAAGCGAFKPMEAGVAEVNRIYVRPEFRRMGVAKAIMAQVAEEARAHGYSTLRLETGTLQPDAVSLYEGLGYHRCPCWGEYANDPISLCYEISL